MTKLGRYFSFKGRTTALGYWRTQVVLGLLWAVIWCSGLLLSEFTGVTAYGKAALVLFLPLLWLGLAVVFRRLHDRNRSGWWLLVLSLVPLIILVALDSKADVGGAFAELALTLVGGVLGLWGFIEIGFLRGTRGKNRFGPDPRGA